MTASQERSFYQIKGPRLARQEDEGSWAYPSYTARRVCTALGLRLVIMGPRVRLAIERVNSVVQASEAVLQKKASDQCVSTGSSKRLGCEADNQTYLPDARSVYRRTSPTATGG
jgi:hypothetical protein